MRSMPRRETRHDIERALAEQPSRVFPGNGSMDAAMIARVQARLEGMRDSLDPAQFVRMEEALNRAIRELGFERRKRRRSDDGGMPAPVEPPRGPKPLAGGAAAPLEFD